MNYCASCAKHQNWPTKVEAPGRATCAVCGGFLPAFCTDIADLPPAPGVVKSSVLADLRETLRQDWGHARQSYLIALADRAAARARYETLQQMESVALSLSQEERESNMRNHDYIVDKKKAEWDYAFVAYQAICQITGSKG